nr:MAG TPA: hypothetical protein [Caudoviricetes sp.]
MVNKIRNCKDIGLNLQKIMKRLMANDNLIKLLYYTDKDPLSNENLSEEQKESEVFEKLIKIVPRIGPKETAKSVIAIRVVDGKKNSENKEFKDVYISIESFVPLTQWMIKGTNLRPFAILGEIEESLNGKIIEGLGRMSGGDFELNFLTEEISSYKQDFYITSYD